MSHCPFGQGIPTSHIGRRELLDFLTHRMTAEQPTSVNVYGKPRMGKTSLLTQFYRTWQQRVVPPDLCNKFVVVYISLEAAECQQEADFYRAVAKQLCKETRVQTTPSLLEVWQLSTWTRTAFSQAIRAWYDQGVVAVLCMDNMERALKHNEAFESGFYENLRSLMDEHQLMLVVVSLEALKLKVYKKQYNVPSLFFNNGLCEELTAFSEMEVDQFLRWAETEGMDARKQRLIQEWGQSHPHRLQLAGLYLWAAKKQGKNEAWAKWQFDKQVALGEIPSPPPPPKPSWGKRLLAPVEWLGNLAKWVAEAYHHNHALLIGIAVVAVVILVVIYGTYDSLVHFVQEIGKHFLHWWESIIGGTH